MKIDPLEVGKSVFEKENISFDNWEIQEMPLNEKEYAVIIYCNKILGKEVALIAFYEGTIDICLYDENLCEDVRYETLKEVLDKQNNL